MRAQFAQYASIVDAMGVIEVGTTDVLLDLTAVPAAFVNGMIVDHAARAPVADHEVAARPVDDGATVAWTRTCVNGSYRLRIPPQRGLYVGTYDEGQNSVPVAYDGTPDGTPFFCEARSITASAAGEEIPMPFDLWRAARISGVFYSQASGCTMPTSGFWVYLDDGVTHACGLGWNPGGPPGTSYAITGLPPAGMIPGLRACVYAPNVAPQCFQLHQPPAFDPIVLEEGEARCGTFLHLALKAIPKKGERAKYGSATKTKKKGW